MGVDRGERPGVTARRTRALPPAARLGMTSEREVAGVSKGVVLGLALALASGACAQRPSNPPALVSKALAGSNVLLVTIDTLRRDRVGAYGSSARLTPTLDGLAAAGVRVTRAYSHAPMTLPAHASILTGRIPVGHGIRTNGTYRLADDVPTLATVLGTAGYRSGAFVGAFVLDARYGLSRGFDHYDDRYPQSGRSSFAYAERRGADVVQAAGDWILAAPPQTPWLAWVHLFDPHAPYEAPIEYRAGRAPYDAEVAYADAMIGRLIERLRAGHALDRTLIVITADHGESLGDHGETTHGLFAYDATLAVPLILTGTGLLPGVVEGTAGHADILPTLCDLLGVAPPRDARRSLARGRARAGPAGVLRGARRRHHARLGAADRGRLRALEVHRPAGA